MASCRVEGRVFQSTHPHGVRPPALVLPSPVFVFQSTHPHGVRPPASRGQRKKSIVSIHAPARGATVDWEAQYKATIVSIHAPARGATAARVRLEALEKFQSTHPHGVRRCLRVIHLRQDVVSIHAPARGATINAISELGPYHVSIHAPARGATAYDVPSGLGKMCFNPRTRTGCDERRRERRSGRNSFNPRTRTGCDRE